MSFSTKKILIPIPDRDFDTTEVSIPWKALTARGYEVVFSTETGQVGQTDPLLLTGVLFGKLGAKPEAIEAYRQLVKSDRFKHPIPYHEIQPTDYELLILPGGHAKGMRQYLESQMLQTKVLEFMKNDQLVAAICHGTIVLARTRDPETGKSVLYGRKVTALTQTLERTAYYLTAWKHGDYYRTYPEYVEEEVIHALQNPHDFQRGQASWKPFCLEDGNLITARYPLDAHVFADALLKRLAEPK
ncbi:type 1 glutamine amidotransferase domain-containing protein [Tumebacillus permanentifrigoris]|uniref:Putative intracellular protease/amidase n=1 Tax=Tumebacillus permanentifrigoris TaxID=378543 RepID=A0A316D8N5_9BACL|nr:type 1 glutamine amidotransferase domain-containing protein [Tumebacillus permanentifrigoris]PWK11559.1 putative intracellular protease/amidase [Tumebacillus permanentifrigoris]